MRDPPSLLQGNADAEAGWSRCTWDYELILCSSSRAANWGRERVHYVIDVLLGGVM
jgi:hypothetical protein